jgi:C1A family cysteine protease
MTKNLFLLTFALGAMLFVTSCQKEEAIEPTNDNAVSYNLGCELLPADEYAALPVAEDVNLKALPSSVYLYVPPIGNQGGEGSCVAWGTAYAARSISYQYANGGSYNYGVNIFSPEYVYNQIKITSSCGSGAYVTSGLYLLRSQGVCNWNLMPYTDVSCSTYPNTTQRNDAANHKIYTYGTVSKNVTAIKTQLAYGKPVVVAGSVYYEYMYLGYNQIITGASGSSYGGHCYTIVGYDDAYQAFKFMNSWGTSWGTNGFGWMSYSVIGTYLSEAYVVYE